MDINRINSVRSSQNKPLLSKQEFLLQACTYLIQTDVSTELERLLAQHITEHIDFTRTYCIRASIHIKPYNVVLLFKPHHLPMYYESHGNADIALKSIIDSDTDRIYQCVNLNYPFRFFIKSKSKPDLSLSVATSNIKLIHSFADVYVYDYICKSYAMYVALLKKIRLNALGEYVELPVDKSTISSFISLT